MILHQNYPLWPKIEPKIEQTLKVIAIEPEFQEFEEFLKNCEKESKTLPSLEM